MIVFHNTDPEKITASEIDVLKYSFCLIGCIIVRSNVYKNCAAMIRPLVLSG